MARAAGPWPQRAGLHDEFHDAWHLLGRPGYAAQSTGTQQPQLLVAAVGVSLQRHPGAVLDRLAGALSDVPSGSRRVLAEHRAPGHDAARGTSICPSRGSARPGGQARGGATDAWPDSDRPVLVCDRHGHVSCLSHLGEYRAHLPGATELRDRAAHPDPAPLLTTLVDDRPAAQVLDRMVMLLEPGVKTRD